MVMVAPALRCLILEGLLNVSEVLLRPRNISGLQVLGKLIKRLGNRTAALRRRSGTALRPELLQGHEV